MQHSREACNIFIFILMSTLIYLLYFGPPLCSFEVSYAPCLLFFSKGYIFFVRLSEIGPEMDEARSCHHCEWQLGRQDRTPWSGAPLQKPGRFYVR
jgi:hypothetical protein